MFHNCFPRTIGLTGGQYSNMVSKGTSSGRTSTNYCVSLYVHVMRKTDGSGGQSQTETDAAIRLLRDDFIGHGISLSVIGVGEIYNTTLYNFSNFFTDCNGDGISDELDCDGDGKFDSFHPNSHLDGIDIYLFDNSVLNSGLASGIPGKSISDWWAHIRSNPSKFTYIVP